MKNYQFIAIDIQNDFASEGGKYYSPKPSVKFLQEIFFPFLTQKSIKVHEIISDYRPPRPGDRGDCCHPGEWGYESLIPKHLVASQWVKCMNSPIWIRENIGNSKAAPGLPYQDPHQFKKWLTDNIGIPEQTIPILIGLTIDCCVLSTLQELSWQGYYPLVLHEGVDHSSGIIKDRDQVLTTPIPNWGKVIDWSELKKQLIK